MAITAVNLTSGNVASATSAVTASISPGANKLDIVSVTNKSAAATANIPTVSGASGTWTQIATQVDAGLIRRVTLFRDLSASPGSGALTIDFAGQSQSGSIDWSIDEFSGIDTTGSHGSGAIVQSNSKTSGGTSAGDNVTLSALGSANNATMGMARATGIVKGANFTELSIVSASYETEWAINQVVVNWTWPSQANTFVAVACEIKAAVAAPTWVGNPYDLMPDKVW